jgi:hypothetical protein
MSFDDDDFDDDDYPPDSEEYLAADSYAAGADAEIAAMQKAEDAHVVWLCNNGREDEAAGGGMPAWFFKALYLDEP